jgi:hypothetical protein
VGCAGTAEISQNKGTNGVKIVILSKLDASFGKNEGFQKRLKGF